MVLSLIMWIPQIYTTYKLQTDCFVTYRTKHTCIWVFVNNVYQYGIAKQSFLVILNHLVGGISEASIVLIVLYYRRKNKSNIMIILNHCTILTLNTRLFLIIITIKYLIVNILIILN